MATEATLSTENNVNGDVFKTQDIHLAVYLQAKGYRLLEVTPINRHRSTFHFDPPSDELIHTFISGSPLADVRSVVNVYRHTIRQSGILQRQAFPNVQMVGADGG